MTSWIDFWNADTPIYVSERHKAAHYRLVAQDIAAAISSPAATVLDYGCGEALAADLVAQNCAKLYLCDAAPLVRERLVARFRECPEIKICSPADIETFGEDVFDLIVANSLVQYLSPAKLSELLTLWRKKLSPSGVLLIADVLPRKSGAVGEAVALLRFGLEKGFFVSACAGLVRTAFSRYPALRRELGLARFNEEEMIARLRDSGFTAQRRKRNLGHNQNRMAFVAGNSGGSQEPLSSAHA